MVVGRLDRIPVRWVGAVVLQEIYLRQTQHRWPGALLDRCCRRGLSCSVSSSDRQLDRWLIRRALGCRRTDTYCCSPVWSSCSRSPGRSEERRVGKEGSCG